MACAKVPFTNRRQGRLLPESMLSSMALTEYQSFLSQNQLSKNATQAEMVRTVGENLKQAVVRFYTRTGRAKELANYKWEFNLVESPDINAWCMPGGKVVVYTGLMPVAQDADGLAVVMGHEIAHALAHHGNERMSQGLIAQMGGVALQVATANQPAQTHNLFMQAYGIGAQVGALLPFSRLQETESDEIGLYLMAMAGYNPDKAADFWKRMSAKAGAKPPVFLSTHPDDSKRAANLKSLVPKAKMMAEKYKAS
ncbi:MAG: M48 family metallopeptidase [Bacteroidia bacterium]